MNRVFKVIWNRTKGCYVVVAETAKNMTKRSSLSVVFSKMVGATAVAVMLTGVMMPTDALGAPITRGNGAQAENDGGIAIGDNTASKGDYSISIGTNASVGRGDTDEGKTQSGIAIGQGATVTVDVAKGADVPADQRTGGIAIGQGATTKVVNAIAVGSGTSADGAQAVTIGHNSRSITNNSVALGNETRVASLNGFALGNNARAGYDETNKLIGLPNDQAFGSNARAYGGSSMAFGNNAKASKGGAIAMGNGSQSRGDWGVAIGNGAKALAQGARAIGANSKADATNAAAMGWDSVASGASSIAIGETSKSTADHSIAMSTSANVAAEDAIAIGHNAQVDANQQRSIALGANSKTANVVSTPNQLVNGLWYKNYAGGSADSTLSVGSDTLKRTITNVAAGRVSATSTDAVNGSQLHAIKDVVDNHENRITTIEGDINTLNNRIINGGANSLNEAKAYTDQQVSSVAAASAALAGLHPLDFDKHDKWSYSVGFGNYKNANAAALGAFYRPNKNTMFNAATTVGNGRNTISLGANFKFGKSSEEVTTEEAAQLKKDMKDLSEKYNELAQKYNELAAKLESK